MKNATVGWRHEVILLGFGHLLKGNYVPFNPIVLVDKGIFKDQHGNNELLVVILVISASRHTNSYIERIEISLTRFCHPGNKQDVLIEEVLYNTTSPFLSRGQILSMVAEKRHQLYVTNKLM